MPQEPKRRHSRQRKGKRRASIRLTTVQGQLCANCGSMTIPHVVCRNCGYYDGKQVLQIKTKTKKNSA